MPEDSQPGSGGESLVAEDRSKEICWVHRAAGGAMLLSVDGVGAGTSVEYVAIPNLSRE
jgi:hypothetical protein